MLDFSEVTEQQFWAWVKATPRNIHPIPTGPWSDEKGYISRWKDLRTDELLGFSWGERLRQPGYKLRSDLEHV